MIKNIKWLGHSTIKICGNIVIYIDPYNIRENFNDADIIFITHNHYDHFSYDDIKKCMNKKTKIVVTKDLFEEAINLGFKEKNIFSILPNKSYELEKISFSTIPAYNINKDFHHKEKEWVGYIINIDNIRYYIAGDTDLTNESKKVKCDVAFLPVGGTFTMNYKEAAMLANEIKPKIVVPIHYGTLVGKKDDALKFKDNLDDSSICEII